MGDILRVGGEFRWERWRMGHFLEAGTIRNGITTAGLNYLLDASFRGSTQLSTWYCGLVDNSGFSAFAAGDTASSHSGWTESQAYSESVRQTWSPAAASSAILQNSAVMAFSMNATTTVKGLFIISNSTKGGTTGTLWSTGAFDDGETKTLYNGEQLRVTYYKLTASGV